MAGLKKIIVIPIILLLCAVVLAAIFTLTGQHPSDMPQNATATSSMPVNGTDAGSGSTGTVYFGIQYEQNVSILGLTHTTRVSVTDANVSIFRVDRMNVSDRYLLNIPGNPASSAYTKLTGHEGIYYKFENVPYGDYVVIAGKGRNVRETFIILNAASDGTIFGIRVLDPDLG